MKQTKHLIKQFICVTLSLLMACAALFELPVTTYAEEFSSYITIQHETDQCCADGISPATTVFNGTSHTFALYSDVALSGLTIDWSITDTTPKGKGTGVTGTVEDSDTTGAIIRFEGTGTCDVTAKVNGSSSDSYYFSTVPLNVCDAYYYAPAQTLFIDHNVSTTLSPEFVKCTKDAPGGEPTTVSGLKWAVTESYLHQKSDITVSADGTVKSAGGNYIVECSHPDLLFATCTFDLKITDGSLTIGTSVKVPALSTSNRSFTPSTSGTYYLESYDAYSSTLYEMNTGTYVAPTLTQTSASKTQIRTYSLTAGTKYCICANNYTKSAQTYKVTSSSSSSTNKTYKITFDKNGGSTVSKTSMKVTSGKTYGALPTAGKKNYTFKGWYTKKTGGTKITASTKVNLTADQTLYAQWRKISTPGKGTISALTNSKAGMMTVKLKKVSNCTGYEISYSTKSNMKSAKTVTSTSLTKNISKLKKGKTYYVRVHAYTKDSLGKKVYGSYSSIKKVKIVK